MANYQLLKADIDAKVYQNGKQEITGENLNSVLNAMVTTLGAEYQFAGVATKDTNPGTPDAKVFYIANGKGTYTNFGGINVTEDDVVVLYWDTAWHKEATGIASQTKLTELGQEALNWQVLDKKYFTLNAYLNSRGEENPSDTTLVGGFLRVTPGMVYALDLNGFKKTITQFAEDKTFISHLTWFDSSEIYTVPDGVGYIRISIRTPEASELPASTFSSFIKVYIRVKPNILNPQVFSDLETSAVSKSAGGYGVCSTAANVAAKNVEISNLSITSHTRFIVKMNNICDVDDNLCTLSVNSGTSYPLYYNGSRASKDNSWTNNEYLDVFYISRSFYATTHAYLKQELGTRKDIVVSQKCVKDAISSLRMSADYSILNIGYFDTFGYINDSGVVYPNENYRVGDYIAVLPNSVLRFILNGYLACVSYFNSSFVYQGRDEWYGTTEFRVIPDGITYIRVGIKNAGKTSLVSFADYIEVSKTDRIAWQNKNVIVAQDGSYTIKNEQKRGFSGILNFQKTMYVGLRKTEETELGTVTVGEENIPSYNITKNYNFNVIYFKNGKVDYETGWTKYEKEIPENTDVAIVFKYTDNSNVENVTSLMNIIGISEEHIYFELPEYYLKDGYLKDKVEYIDNLIRGCACNGDIFIHISDLHWQGNQQHSPALIKYITDRLPIKRMFNTGDDFDGTATRLAVGPPAVYENVNVFIPFKNAFDGDYYWTVGNHDHLLGYKNTYDDLCATHHQLDDKVVFGGTTKSYYYVDNTQQKIRYIVLDAFDAGETGYTHYGPEQLSWLENTALNVESGWTILLFCHMIYYITASENFDFADITDARFLALKNILVNYSGNGTIAAVFQGDAHVDRVFRLNGEGSIPVICITTDKCDGALNVNREVGTINEQAFDVVVVDKTNRKITCVRIGAKAKDGVGLTTQGNDVEIREVSY